MDIRILLNGKKAGLETVRSAIFKARETGNVEVRVTWEAGDVQRLVREACQDGCQRLVAGGGDGTVNEVADAILQMDEDQRPEIAVMPLGTANDFATGCTIPSDPLLALQLAQTGKARSVDAVKANEYCFINVASGGFGAQVTANTPVALKNFLGGGAYTLSGLVQAVNFSPFHGEIRLPGEAFKSDVIFGAVCNGRQAGGGQQLAPQAMIDDGLLDIVGLKHFPAEALTQVVEELLSPDKNGEYVNRYRVPWTEWESDVEMPINLDGEPISSKKVRFEVLPGSIKLILPENCPMVGA
ncbi:MAG: lipid kinase YegS [Arenicellales bacterium]